MTINIFLVYLSAILIGISLANFIVTNKNDRFHFLFALTITSSFCLISIIYAREASTVFLSTGVYGLCIGLSTAIAINWCLSLNEPRKAQNLQINLLQILSLFGMIFFFCFLASRVDPPGAYTNMSDFNRSNLHSLLITTTTPKVHLKKPESADGIFLEQSHVTKPTPVDRRKRQFIFSESSTATTTTSEKVHLKKPESANGNLLEQSHITKPTDLIGMATTKNENQVVEKYDNEYIEKSNELGECLRKLERRCVLKLDKCRVDESETKSPTDVKVVNLTGKASKIKNILKKILKLKNSRLIEVKIFSKLDIFSL